MASHLLSVTAPPRRHSRAALRVVQPPSGVDLVAAEQAAAAFLVALSVDLDTESLAATTPGWPAPTPRCSALALST